MDPFAVLRFPVLVIRAGVRRFGWKAVVIGWILSGIAAVILEHTI